MKKSKWQVWLNSRHFNSCRFIFAINLWNFQVAKESQTVELNDVKMEMCQKMWKRKKKKSVCTELWSEAGVCMYLGRDPAHDLHCFLSRHKQDESGKRIWDLFFPLFVYFSFILFFLIFAMQMIIKKHWSASLCCDTSIYHQRAAFNLWLNSMTNHHPPLLKTCKLFNLM